MSLFVVGFLPFLWGSAVQTITFDSARYGQPPAGWTIAMTHHGASPRWEVRKDDTAPSKPYVLAQVSSDRTPERFPLAIVDGVQCRDGDISVLFKPVSGKEDQAAGLVWRYRDPDNYYLVRANALEKNVVLYKVQNGRRTQIQPAGKLRDAYLVKKDIPANAWHTLRVIFRGSSFEVFLNHRRVLRADDATFASAGKVGLWTKADSVTYFDNFRVVPR